MLGLTVREGLGGPYAAGMRAELRPELRRGAELFNAGQWWEAHEAWEAEWMHAEGQEKQFIQGLILLAAALHKRWHHGSLTGRNYVKALAKLEGLPDEYGGLHLPTLRRDVERALGQRGFYPQLPLTGANGDGTRYPSRQS